MGTLRPYQADILERTRDAYRRGYKRPCIVLGCGGGKSCIIAEIAKGAVLKGGRVLFLVHRRELTAQIHKTFSSWGVPMGGMDIMMVQTATRRVKTLAPPTLIVTDENHHALAASYRRIYDAFPEVPCVGMTATPCRLNGGGLGDVNDTLIEGVPTRWLIDNGYLADYDYYAPSVADLTGLKSVRGEYQASEIAEKMNKAAIRGDVIRHWEQYAKGRKTIVYCASVRHSEDTAQAFRDAGYEARHIDGDTPDAARDEIIEGFRRGEVTVLCNCELISEGFDVPDCDCVVLLRPTKSLTLYIQQSMRCMRPAPGKRAVILDHVGNYARHGMPDAEREWTLDAKPKKEGDKAPTTRTCPDCFGVFFPEGAGRACPYCGYEIPYAAREIAEIKQASLEKVEGFTIRHDSAPRDCKTYAELVELAKRKGYKPGWAYITGKRMGFL